MIAELATEQLIGVVLIGAHRLRATVAVLSSDGDEQPISHKSLDCRWHDLDEGGRREALAEVIALACRSADAELFSVSLAIQDASLAAHRAHGSAHTGEDMILGEADRRLALDRAREQATGSDREVLTVLPLSWRVRTRKQGERDVADPVREYGHHINLEALRVTVRSGLQAEYRRLADSLDLALDAIIPQPVALWRGIQGRLTGKGGSVLIDCGAKHTSLLVCHRDRLVHVETHLFGADDLTYRIAEGLGLEVQEAEDLKRELDVGEAVQAVHHAGQQTIWNDLGDRQARHAPAAKLCADQLSQFFLARAAELRDHNLISQSCRVHLVGRGARLGGLVRLVQDAFDCPVVLGSGDGRRDPGAEFDDLMTAGLLRIAGEERRESNRIRRGSVIVQATGVWAWLTAELR